MEENKKRFKYVRTTHGVFEISKEYGDCVMCGIEQEFKNLCEKNFDCYYIDARNQAIYSRRNGIGIMFPYIKSADAIEELCDCYLEDWGKGIPHIVTKHMMSVWSEVHKGKALRGETTFYACIIKRDGKGTHIEPVAKMNEKGEFELL